MQADIYELILHALSEDPPRIGIDMTDIQRRIANILEPAERAPQPLTISNTLSTILKILHASGDLFQILEWRDQELHILDPYFLFFLRWSDK